MVTLPSLDALDAVLFDAGGTLIELDYALIGVLCARHAPPIAPEALRRAEGAARREIDRRAERADLGLEDDVARRPSYFATLLDAAGLEAGVRAAVVADLEAEHARMNLWRVAVREARSALERLCARGLRLAVISNSDGRVAEVLASVGLAEHFEQIVDSHFEGVEKPDPAIFQRTLARLGVQPERACYVGDIYTIDARGARAAGLHPVLVDGVGAYEALDCACIASLDELG